MTVARRDAAKVGIAPIAVAAIAAGAIAKAMNVVVISVVLMGALVFAPKTVVTVPLVLSVPTIAIHDAMVVAEAVVVIPPPPLQLLSPAKACAKPLLEGCTMALLVRALSKLLW